MNEWVGGEGWVVGGLKIRDRVNEEVVQWANMCQVKNTQLNRNEED